MRISPRTKEKVAPEVLELLARRAERMRYKPVASQEDSVLWVAEFAMGEDRYALALESLRACVPLKMVTPVPLSSSQVIGILRFQGQIVTALSLASLLGVRGWREDPKVLLVVDTGWGQVVALDCEQIPKPVGLPIALVEQSRSKEHGPVLDITTREMKQVGLIDLRKLLDRRGGNR